MLNFSISQHGTNGVSPRYVYVEASDELANRKRSTGTLGGIPKDDSQLIRVHIE